MIKKLGYILFVLFTFQKAVAQNVEVKAQIDKSEIVIGDAINLKLSTTYNPQEYKVYLPALSDTFNHFEIVEKNKPDTVINRDRNTIVQNIVITNFDSGRWLIPKLSYNVSPLNGTAPYTLLSDSFLVNVNTIAVDTAKPFKPIFGIREASLPVEKIIMYVVIGLLILAAIIFVIIYFVKKYRQKNIKPAQPEIKLMPHEKALNNLQKLQKENLWQNGNEKTYYTELTDIVRCYLEEQFEIDCFEKTSSEIMSQVKKIKALSTSRQALRNLLETADMVKFAKGKPNEDEHIEHLENSKEVVLESYKKVKPIEEQKQKA